MTREAEVVAADAAAVRLRAESLIDDVIQMAVDAANGLSCLLTFILYVDDSAEPSHT